MSDGEDQIDWSKTTFGGVREEQLRRALMITVRERLKSMDELNRLSERLQAMPKRYPVASAATESMDARDLRKAP
ncbi:MAG: hypothetical protein QJR02_03765 [Sinobacteraceae bacterium]|nr:hypothetical protein [Nevskiaceae bacterium]